MELNSGGCRVSFLDEHMENYNIETSAIHRKLQSKVEALKIMRKELEQYRIERDQFKLMAETIQMRYTAIKKSLNTGDCGNIDYMEKSSVAALLNDIREKNIALTTEVETLKQKLSEKEGDIRVLREQQKSVQSLNKFSNNNVNKNTTDNDWSAEKSNFIAQLESLKKKNAQLQYDFRALLDEKEEIVTERDAYKCKVHRLNHELNVALKGSGPQVNVLDIDALVLENKYLQERLKNMESELDLAQQSASKYKTMLDTKRKKGIIKLGSNNTTDMIMSHKQVKNVLENGTDSELPQKAATISNLKSLCLALLDNVNDKNLALSHQKKANKILASRIAELEQRLQMFCSGNDHSDTTGNLGANLLSPSQLLLNGYCSATVDKEYKLPNFTENCYPIPTCSDETKHLETKLNSLDPISSEFTKSVNFSLHEDNGFCAESDSSSEYTMNSKTTECDDKTSAQSNNIEKLEELPLELALMVEQALKEIQVNETDNE